MMVDDDDIVVANAAQALQYLSERSDYQVFRRYSAFKSFTSLSK